MPVKITKDGRTGNWGNRKGFDPWRKRKINASGELWCKGCKGYHPKDQFSPQHGFYAQRCRLSRNESLKKLRTREAECKHCGTKFVSRNRMQSYCSKRCKSKAVDAKNSTAVSTCPNCQVEFKRPPRHRQKYCSKRCGYISRRRSPDKALARGKRGTNWPAQSALARVRDGNICVICDATNGPNITVDHIIPYRLALELNPDPNNLANLACMCSSCHGTKTGIEAAILRGDIMGFVMGMRCRVGLDEDRLFAAMRFIGLPVHRRRL